MMKFDFDALKLILFAVILVVSFLGPLIERWKRRRAEEKGEPAPPGPPPPEPQLPYEDMVDKLFGPYMVQVGLWSRRSDRQKEWLLAHPAYLRRNI